MGVQDATGARFTQFECNTGGLSAGMQINFTFAGCGPTNTPTRTNTPGGPTNTPTRTATPGGTPCVVDGTWSTGAPYPITILDNAAASVGGFVYSFSGVSGGLLVPNSYKYDPTANTWTPIAPLPAAREQASAVSDGTNIYIMGGAD